MASYSVGGQGAGLLLDPLRELGVGARVEGDDPVDQRAFEDRGSMVWYLPTDAAERPFSVAVVTQRWISEGRILPIGRRPKTGMKCLSR